VSRSTPTVETDPALLPGAEQLVRATWRRTRFWLVIGLIVLVAAVLVAALTAPGGRPLDPASPSKGSSLALVRLLGDRGVTTNRITSLTAISAPTVVIAFPDSYSTDQLTQLSRQHRVILVEPDQAALSAASGQQLQLGPTDPDSAPDCALSGPATAGAVTLIEDAGAATYAGAPGWSGTLCYGGAVAIAPNLVALGSAQLLINAHLADTGVAALDLNVISNNGTVSAIDWLLPGADAAGQGEPSIWRVLPDWTPRAVLVLIVFGLIVALWRGRRLGPVVVEPLPVVVRSAELIEGHGRLYERGRAGSQVAAALREGSRARLAARLGLPSSATPTQVSYAVELQSHISAAALVAPPNEPPPTDATLVTLAAELDELERAAGTVHPMPNEEAL
jgi:hypothetical protein